MSIKDRYDRIETWVLGQFPDSDFVWPTFVGLVLAAPIVVAMVLLFRWIS